MTKKQFYDKHIDLFKDLSDGDIDLTPDAEGVQTPDIGVCWAMITDILNGNQGGAKEKYKLEKYYDWDQIAADYKSVTDR